MAVKAQRITVPTGTTPTLLTVPETDSTIGERVTVRNADTTNTVDLGGSAVASGAGFTLTAGASYQFQLNGGEQLYAVLNGTTAVVLHVLSTSV